MQERVRKYDLFTRFVESQIPGIKVVKEHMFALPRLWRFDYAILEHRIAIEQEGGAYKKRKYKNKKGEEITTMGGRHNSASGFLADMEKYNNAAVRGWLVLRYTPQQLMTLGTVEQIEEAIEYRKAGK